MTLAERQGRQIICRQDPTDEALLDDLLPEDLQ